MGRQGSWEHKRRNTAKAVSEEEKEILVLDIEDDSQQQSVEVQPHKNYKMKPTAELVAIALVYMVQGILGLSKLAVAFFFKDELQLEPSQVALLTSIAMSPWLVKPIYGFLSDGVPLFGYRRRSYLMLCGLLGAGSWLTLAWGVTSVEGAVLCLMLSSFSIACSDVVVDSIVVERSRGEPLSTAGSLQSLCWAAQSGGGILSAYFSGSLVQTFGTHPVFAATAIFPLFVSCSAMLIAEQRVEVVPSGKGVLQQPPIFVRLRDQGKALWGAVKQQDILLPAAFVFLWQATPTPDTAMFYYYTEELHFNAEFLGVVTLVGKIASLLGVGVYNFLLKQVPLRTMFLWCSVLGTGLGMTQLILITGLNQQWGLSNELFVVGDSLVLTVLGQVSFMPIMVLAARVCPTGVEATLFATLMSVMNGGYFVAMSGGAVLTEWLGVTSKNFTNLALLVLICNLSSLLPLPLLKFVPDEKEEKTREADGEKAGK